MIASLVYRVSTFGAPPSVVDSSYMMIVPMLLMTVSHTCTIAGNPGGGLNYVAVWNMANCNSSSSNDVIQSMKMMKER